MGLFRMKVPVLFTQAKSIYQNMDECDCYGIDRDAKTYSGIHAVIAHPPCRAWGQLAHFAKPRPGEKDLALWAVDKIREVGGVLEHPRASRLWKEKPLPAPGQFDEFGGFTLPVYQLWWGHLAQKATFLYICGCGPAEVPEIPLYLGTATHVVSRSRAKGTKLPEISKKAREATPPAFAQWLVDLALVIEKKKAAVAA